MNSEIINSDFLSFFLHRFASDEFNGRQNGTNGEILACKFLSDYYTKIGFTKVSEKEAYIMINNNSSINLGKKIIFEQKFKYSHRNSSVSESMNIIACIIGNEQNESGIVFSAHYDHVGQEHGHLTKKTENAKEGDIVFNGADDNGSGTVSLMKIALNISKHNKNKKTVVFLHCGAEELGLLGSKYYSDNPIIPLDRTMVNINLDMVGRGKNKHIYAIIGPEGGRGDIDFISEFKKINESQRECEIDYKYDTPRKQLYRMVKVFHH